MGDLISKGELNVLEGVTPEHQKEHFNSEDWKQEIKDWEIIDKKTGFYNVRKQRVYYYIGGDLKLRDGKIMIRELMRIQEKKWELIISKGFRNSFYQFETLLEAMEAFTLNKNQF